MWNLSFFLRVDERKNMTNEKDEMMHHPIHHCDDEVWVEAATTTVSATTMATASGGIDNPTTVVDDDTHQPQNHHRMISSTAGETTNARRHSPKQERHRRLQTGSFILQRAAKRQEKYVQECERDRIDTEISIRRERKFTVAYTKLSRNRIFTDDEGPPVVLFEDSVQKYKLSGYNTSKSLIDSSNDVGGRRCGWLCGCKRRKDKNAATSQKQALEEDEDKMEEKKHNTEEDHNVTIGNVTAAASAVGGIPTTTANATANFENRHIYTTTTSNGASTSDCDGDQVIIWPRGRNVNDLGLYGQVLDYFVFMWRHTKPYKTVGFIVLLATMKPFQNLAVSYVANAVETSQFDDENKNNNIGGVGVPLYVYFLPVLVSVVERCVYWQYQLDVPLNSQRYQLRCMLLTQRVKIPDSHELAMKWTAGRFNGLLRDIDELVNGVWGSCLDIIKEMVTIVWTIVFCFLNLAIVYQKGYDPDLPDLLPTVDYVSYLILFLFVGLFTMLFPFVWFSKFGFVDALNSCETMVHDGQALYLSSASHAVRVDSAIHSEEEESLSLPFLWKDKNGRNHGTSHSSRPVKTDNIQDGHIDFDGDNCDDGTSLALHHYRRNSAATAAAVRKKRGVLTLSARKSFRVFALTTFRSFFLKLAWTTNYEIIMSIIGAIVGYLILSAEGFGNRFSITSTLVVLLSLGDLTLISKRLLDYLTLMSRGCLVLSDVAELLNYSRDNNSSFSVHGDDGGGNTEYFGDEHDIEVGGQSNKNIDPNSIGDGDDVNDLASHYTNVMRDSNDDEEYGDISKKESDSSPIKPTKTMVRVLFDDDVNNGFNNTDTGANTFVGASDESHRNMMAVGNTPEDQEADIGNSRFSKGISIKETRLPEVRSGSESGDEEEKKGNDDEEETIPNNIDDDHNGILDTDRVCSSMHQIMPQWNPPTESSSSLIFYQVNEEDDIEAQLVKEDSDRRS